MRIYFLIEVFDIQPLQGSFRDICRIFKAYLPHLTRESTTSPPDLQFNSTSTPFHRYRN
ncbi:MAG: hypothetical protein IPJ86_06905 [Bacteroidetes bacterium]|nr:hypothetical protein [Bacteroidota bacterium]